jgi:hypothetical protein
VPRQPASPEPQPSYQEIDSRNPPPEQPPAGDGLPPTDTVADPARRLVVILADAFVCLVVLAVGFATAIGVARGRGAHSVAAVTDRLGWIHLVLALAVVVVYGAGGWWIAGRTPGQVLADRMVGARPQFRRSMLASAVPALVLALLVAVPTGRAVPTGGGVPVGAGAESQAASPSGSGSLAAPAGEASSTAAGGGATATETTEPTPADGSAQAAAVDHLLGASTTSRGLLRSALNDLDQCVNAGTAVANLRRVTSQRAAQLDQARTLRTDLLPGGETIRDALIAALSHSVAADQAFTAWGERVASGRCGHEAHYRDGMDASAAAQVSKKQFCAAWNPVAQSFGLPTRSEAEI